MALFISMESICRCEFGIYLSNFQDVTPRKMSQRIKATWGKHPIKNPLMMVPSFHTCTPYLSSLPLTLTPSNMNGLKEEDRINWGYFITSAPKFFVVKRNLIRLISREIMAGVRYTSTRYSSDNKDFIPPSKGFPNVSASSALLRRRESF